MPAAYTLYKFRKLFGLVLAIAVVLIFWYQFNNTVDDAKGEIARTDSSGMATKALETQEVYETISNPKGVVEHSTGGFLNNLLSKNSEAFMWLIFLTAAVLFFSGVRLSSLRAYLHRLLRI